MERAESALTDPAAHVKKSRVEPNCTRKPLSFMARRVLSQFTF